MRSTSQVIDQKGFALIDLLFVVALIGTIASIAMPGLLRARSQAGVTSAIGSLRVINSAQLSYAITCGSGFYAPTLVVLGTKPPASSEAFISEDLGSAATVKKANFLIQMSGAPIAGSPQSCNGVAAGAGAQAYKAGADPLDAVAGRFFATNASGVIYEAALSLYAGMPEAAPPIGGTPVH
jgi:type II secretory pathway pseudopilin PulG